MSKSQATCPDCNVELEPIKLIDATEKNFQEGCFRVDLTYAARDTKAPLFFGGIQPKGKVEGNICPKCGRILLYGRSL